MIKKVIGFTGLLVLVVVFISQVQVSKAKTTPVTDAQVAVSQQWQQPPAGGVVQPFAGAPKCTSHNPNEWHSLWNYAQGCHYTHEHKHNPGILYAGIPDYERQEAQAMLSLFGPPGAWFNGTSISYPWQTFRGAGANHPAAPSDYTAYENSAKHAGYGWIVRYNLPQKWGKEWIKDFRLQFHAILASAGITTRYHSFSLEANVCHQDGGCRIVRTGGWVDFGRLTVDGIPVHLNDGAEADTNRRRLHFSANDTAAFAGDQYKLPFFWYGTVADVESNRPWDPNRPFRKLVISLAGKDVWTNPDPNEPYYNDFFCPDYQCNKNGSTIQAHFIHLEALQDEFSGWTDRYGETNLNCGVASLDCIPTSIEAGTTGKILTNYRDAGNAGYSAEGQRDFDISPDGEWWIEFPN